MSSVIILVCLLLTALACGSASQEDQPCTDWYEEFESASVGSNISGNNIRNQLYKAFYAPNQHLPYSVIVTYQLLLANGTRLNLSSEQDCSSELWVWMSSPVFLLVKITFLNRLLLFTLTYFMEWDPHHVSITTAMAPCLDKMGSFLNEMTASLQDYALGQMEYKRNLGYVKRGCGTSMPYTVFTEVDKTVRTKVDMLDICHDFGLLFQVVFVWIVSAVLLKMTFKKYAAETFTYSYDMYGLFWGISTTAVGLFGMLIWIYMSTTFLFIEYLKNAANQISLYLLLGALVAILLAEMPVAIYTARKATVAVPCIFKHPATLLCCGRKRQAEYLITTIALWVDLVVLQLILFQGSLFVMTLSAAPFAITSNVMLIVLALSCLTSFFSLLFIIFAHLCTPSNQRVHSSSMVLRAVVVLPLLLMLLCYGVVFTTMGSVTNVDAKRSNFISFINSITTPILLGLVGIFQNKFICAWLKWSPQETEQIADTSRRHEADEELLDT